MNEQNWKKRELSDDILELEDAFESTFQEIVQLLERFNVGEYLEKSFHVGDSPHDTTKMTNYIKRLKEEGLDIGKGENFEWGYRMPLPENNTPIRYLHLFRRKQ